MRIKLFTACWVITSALWFDSGTNFIGSKNELSQNISNFQLEPTGVVWNSSQESMDSEMQPTQCSPSWSRLDICFDTQCVLRPSVARTLKGFKACFADCGDDHSAIIDVHGRVILFGSNKRGQLGTSDCNPVTGCHVMSGTFAGRKCRLLSCGDYFTVAITTDNEIYAWGYAADGRLGFSMDRVIDSSTNKSSQSVVNRPRPIFGSLHSVTALASNSWHTILVAEKVQSIKTINTDCQSSSTSGNFSTSNFSLDIPDYIRETDYENYAGTESSSGSCQRNSPAASSNPETGPEDTWVPDWLKHELEDAECIPIESTRESAIEIQSHGPDIPEDCLAIKVPPLQLSKTGEDNSDKLRQMEEEMKKLRCQNARLTDLVAEQQIQISEIQSLLDRQIKN